MIEKLQINLWLIKQLSWNIVIFTAAATTVAAVTAATTTVEHLDPNYITQNSIEKIKVTHYFHCNCAYNPKQIEFIMVDAQIPGFY